MGEIILLHTAGFGSALSWSSSSDDSSELLDEQASSWKQTPAMEKKVIISRQKCKWTFYYLPTALLEIFYVYSILICKFVGRSRGVLPWKKIDFTCSWNFEIKVTFNFHLNIWIANTITWVFVFVQYYIVCTHGTYIQTIFIPSTRIQPFFFYFLIKNKSFIL